MVTASANKTSSNHKSLLWVTPSSRSVRYAGHPDAVGFIKYGDLLSCTREDNFRLVSVQRQVVSDVPPGQHRMIASVVSVQRQVVPDVPSPQHRMIASVLLACRGRLFLMCHRVSTE